jgi:hypothetical protein
LPFVVAKACSADFSFSVLSFWLKTRHPSE